MLNKRENYEFRQMSGHRIENKQFRVQLLKDYAMAHYINKLIEEDQNDQKYLVISGKGHVWYNYGVPQRVFAVHPDVKDQSAVVIAQ